MNPEQTDPAQGPIGDIAVKVLDKGFGIIDIAVDQLKFVYDRAGKGGDAVLGEFDVWLKQGKDLLKRLAKESPI